MIGYYFGEFPPKMKSIFAFARANDTLMKMHAIAYKTIKKIDPEAKVGIVKNIGVVRAWRPKSPFDKLAAKVADYIYNGSTLRALKKGKLFWHVFRSDKRLKNTNDFLGLNFYNFVLVSGKIKGLFSVSTPHADPSTLCDELNWEAYPEGLLINLRRLNKEFPHLPIYITENGVGTTNDSWRQRLLVDHLKMVHKALSEGVDVKGYFHWSLMDNFEWCQGYSSRFGLYETNFETMERTIKESGRIYANISKNNALTPEVLEKFPEEIYKPDFSLRKK